MSRYVEPHAELNTLVDIANELRTANTLKILQISRQWDHDETEDYDVWKRLRAEYIK